MTLNVEKKVFGSLTNEQGDGVLSYTSGISPAADNFGALLTGNAQAPLSDKYASLIFLTNPDNALLTFLHVQGNYTVFPGMARAYDTRAVYEITHENFMTQALGQYAAIVKGLDGMHSYDKREFGVSNLTDVTPSKVTLTPIEEKLRLIIARCVMTNQQLFIRIGEDEDLYADNIRQSWRLEAILHAMDALPSSLRPYLSMAYSVDSKTTAIRTLADHILVMVHHDDISQWGTAQSRAMIIDWQESEPTLVNAQEANANELRAMESTAPLLREFLGKNPIHRTTISNLLNLIPNNVDKVLSTPTQVPSDNDKMILAAVFNSDKGCYKHQEVTERIFFLITHGHTVKGVSIARILDFYPHLRSHADLAPCIDKLMQRCDNTEKLSKIYEALRLADVMKEKTLAWILKNKLLLNGMPRVADTRLGRELQPDIVANVKRVRNDWKVDHIDEPYFDLSIDDIELTDWYAYAQVMKALLNKPGGIERIKALKTDAKRWGAERLDMSVYQRVKKYVSDEDILSMLDALKSNGQLYCDIMDDLLGGQTDDPKSMIVHKDAKYLHIYLIYKTKSKPLSTVRPLALGIDYALLDARLLSFLQRNNCFKRFETYTDALKLYAERKTLDEKAIAAFMDILDQLYPHPTLLQLATIHNKVYSLLKAYFTAERIRRTTQIGDSQQFDRQMAAMKKTQTPKELRDTYSDHAHDLLIADCPKTFDELLRELNKQPLTAEHFCAIETESDVLLLCPNMQMEDYVKLHKLVSKQEKELKRIDKLKPFYKALSDYALAQLPQWFQTQDVTKSYFVKQIAPLRAKDAKFFALRQMSKLGDDELQSLKAKFTRFCGQKHRDEEKFKTNRQQLQLAINALVEALKKRNMLEEDSPLLKYANRQGLKQKRTISRKAFKTFLIAFAFTLLVAIVVTAIVLTHKPHKKPKEERTYVAELTTDSHKRDSLLADSIRRDSLRRDSLKHDALRRDSIAKHSAGTPTTPQQTNDRSK